MTKESAAPTTARNMGAMAIGSHSCALVQAITFNMATTIDSAITDIWGEVQHERQQLSCSLVNDFEQAVDAGLANVEPGFSADQISRHGRIVAMEKIARDMTDDFHKCMTGRSSINFLPLCGDYSVETSPTAITLFTKEQFGFRSGEQILLAMEDGALHLVLVDVVNGEYQPVDADGPVTLVEMKILFTYTALAPAVPTPKAEEKPGSAKPPATKKPAAKKPAAKKPATRRGRTSAKPAAKPAAKATTRTRAKAAAKPAASAEDSGTNQ